MSSIRKQEVSEYLWYCALCNNTHKEYIRDVEYFRKDGGSELTDAGWTIVPMSSEVWPVDSVVDDDALFFCPDHGDAARLIRLVVGIIERRAELVS